MKQTIRLNERELHTLISESVKRVLNETISHNHRGNLVWNPKHNTEYSIGPDGENGWPNLLKNGKNSGYQVFGWQELPDENGDYTSREYSLWNSLKRNSTDFIDQDIDDDEYEEDEF